MKLDVVILKWQQKYNIIYNWIEKQWVIIAKSIKYLRRSQLTL